MIYLKDELHGGANKMNNEKAFLYDLCERTHTARVIGKLILEKLNIALQNAADHSLSGVNIELVNFGDEDIKISDKYKEDIIFSYPNELTKIYINVAKIPLPALSIRDFIHQYYLERNLDSSFTCNEIYLSWNQYIEEYIGSQTKASENIAEPYNGGCIDVNKVIEDIESFLQTCSRIRKTKYIHLSIIFCDLNLEEDIFDGDLDDMTYTIKLPDNDRGQAFLGDIYQYFQDNGKYDIEFRPIEKLSENRRYKISYHIEDKIDDTKSTSDAVAQTEKITAETVEAFDGDDILYRSLSETDKVELDNIIHRLKMRIEDSDPNENIFLAAFVSTNIDPKYEKKLVEKGPYNLLIDMKPDRIERMAEKLSDDFYDEECECNTSTEYITNEENGWIQYCVIHIVYEKRYNSSREDEDTVEGSTIDVTYPPLKMQKFVDLHIDDSLPVQICIKNFEPAIISSNVDTWTYYHNILSGDEETCEWVAKTVIDYFTENGYTVKRVATAYNDDGDIGYILLRITNSDIINNTNLASISDIMDISSTSDASEKTTLKKYGFCK